MLDAQGVLVDYELGRLSRGQALAHLEEMGFSAKQAENLIEFGKPTGEFNGGLEAGDPPFMADDLLPSEVIQLAQAAANLGDLDGAVRYLGTLSRLVGIDEAPVLLEEARFSIPSWVSRPLDPRMPIPRERVRGFAYP